MALETRRRRSALGPGDEPRRHAARTRSSTGPSSTPSPPASTGRRGPRRSVRPETALARSSCASPTSSPGWPRSWTRCRWRTGRRGCPGASSPPPPRSWQRVRRGGLRLLRPHARPARRSCASAGSAASAWSRARSARRVGKLYVEQHFPPDGEGAHGRAGRQPGRGLPAEHHRPRLDERGDPGAGRWTSSSAFTPKIGYPDRWRDYSTLEITPGRPGRQRRGAPDAFELDRELRQARQADRPRRVVHDAADGERLLQPADERDRVPGRDPAAAVLRRRGRRRGELRRDRRRDRPRDRPRLRRPGRQVRRRRQPARLVDRRRTASEFDEARPRR